MQRFDDTIENQPMVANLVYQQPRTNLRNKSLSRPVAIQISMIVSSYWRLWNTLKSSNHLPPPAPEMEGNNLHTDRFQRDKSKVLASADYSPQPTVEMQILEEGFTLEEFEKELIEVRHCDPDVEILKIIAVEALTLGAKEILFENQMVMIKAK